MTESNGQSIPHRYDFVYFFEVIDGNPNGDPDAGNLPRLDPETGQGLVTDVCLKRKVRNYVALAKEEQPPFDIYVKERALLNDQHERAYKHYELKPVPKKLPKDEDDARKITRWMCDNFFDIRTFGAVMTTDVNAGQVRGPIQLGIARSLHPIVSSEMAVTRCAVTNKKDLEKERTMGRKFAIPYALYRVHGYVNANLAAQTGFGKDDLDLFKLALDQMFEHDRSAARGNMNPVACVAFKHENKLGNARADQLFKRVTCAPKADVQPLAGQNGAALDARPPRSFDDYSLEVDKEGLPSGVTVEHWVKWE